MTAAADPTPQPTVDVEQPSLDAEQTTGDAEQTTVDAEQPSVDAEQAPIDIPDAIAGAEEAPVGAEQPPLDVEQPSVDAQEAVAEPEESTVGAEESSVDAQQAPAAAEESTVEAEQPAVDTEQPSVDAEEAIAEPEESTVGAEQPSVDTEQLAVDSQDVPADTEQPAVVAEQPSVDSQEPPAEAQEPPVDPEQPTVEAADAALDVEAPTAGTGAPAVEPARPVAPKPTPPRSTAPRPTAATEPWGRVDDDGTVSVREGDDWRVVGQFPDGSTEEALAYFERKFTDLAGEVTLLEVRHRRAGASPSDLRTAARLVSEKISGAAAVGDLAALEARVVALTETLAAESESEAAAAREAVDEAVKTRTELVEKAEALAARDPKGVQWKQASTELTSLFDQWQAQQQHGPRLPKSTAQQLWKRFRDARATVDKHRREFYAELDEAHKGVRDRKAKLVEKAEALAAKGEEGIADYRELLDQWKTAGRAGKKADDALWARFKAAGDALYSARGEREAADAEASREKIAAKRILLEEAKTVADESDITKARSLLTGIQRRWDEVGRIFPRDSERGLDDELRKIEQSLRAREDVDWKRNNPETKARANDMTRQLTEAIQKLEDALAAAQKSGDKAAIANASEALEARKGWLRALGGS